MEDQVVALQELVDGLTMIYSQPPVSCKYANGPIHDAPMALCSQDGCRLEFGALRSRSLTIGSRLPTRHRWLMRRPFLTMSIPTVSIML